MTLLHRRESLIKTTFMSLHSDSSSPSLDGKSDVGSVSSSGPNSRSLIDSPLLHRTHPPSISIVKAILPLNASLSPDTPTINMFIFSLLSLAFHHSDNHVASSSSTLPSTSASSPPWMLLAFFGSLNIPWSHLGLRSPLEIYVHDILRKNWYTANASDLQSLVTTYPYQFLKLPNLTTGVLAIIRKQIRISRCSREAAEWILKHTEYFPLDKHGKLEAFGIHALLRHDCTIGVWDGLKVRSGLAWGWYLEYLASAQPHYHRNNHPSGDYIESLRVLMKESWFRDSPILISIPLESFITYISSTTTPSPEIMNVIQCTLTGILDLDSKVFHQPLKQRVFPALITLVSLMRSSEAFDTVVGVGVERGYWMYDHGLRVLLKAVETFPSTERVSVLKSVCGDLRWGSRKVSDDVLERVEVLRGKNNELGFKVGTGVPSLTKVGASAGIVERKVEGFRNPFTTYPRVTPRTTAAWTHILSLAKHVGDPPHTKKLISGFESSGCVPDERWEREKFKALGCIGEFGLSRDVDVECFQEAVLGRSVVLLERLQHFEPVLIKDFERLVAVLEGLSESKGGVCLEGRNGRILKSCSVMLRGLKTLRTRSSQTIPPPLSSVADTATLITYLELRIVLVSREIFRLSYSGTKVGAGKGGMMSHLTCLRRGLHLHPSPLSELEGLVIGKGGGKAKNTETDIINILLSAYLEMNHPKTKDLMNGMMWNASTATTIMSRDFSAGQYDKVLEVFFGAAGGGGNGVKRVVGGVSPEMVNVAIMAFGRLGRELPPNWDVDVLMRGETPAPLPPQRQVRDRTRSINTTRLAVLLDYLGYTRNASGLNAVFEYLSVPSPRSWKEWVGMSNVYNSYIEALGRIQTPVGDNNVGVGEELRNMVTKVAETMGVRGVPAFEKTRRAVKGVIGE